MKTTFYTSPPARAIAEAFSVPLETGKTARALIKGEIRVTGNPDFPATNQWLDACYHKPSRVSLILSALDELLGCYGVEAFRSGSGSLHAIAEYLNTGDTYSVTLLFRHDTGTFRLTTWGDFFERNERRLDLCSF